MFLSRFKQFQVNWSNIYWFNIILITVMSVAALGLSLALIINQHGQNWEMKTLEISGPVEIITNDCDTYFQLQMQFNDMHIQLPSPKLVTGCSFAFAYESAPSDQAEIIISTPNGKFQGVAWTNSTLTASHIINEANVTMNGASMNQMYIISDGTNYKLTSPAIGVS